MKRIIVARQNNEVRLHVEYEPYERYNKVPLKKANITAPTELDALAKMADKMNLYVTSEDILGGKYSDIDELISDIVYENGDGCDFIYLLRNDTTGQVYIDESQDEAEEEW